MYGNPVDEHVDMDMTGHMNMDGVINATYEHHWSNMKKHGNAKYFQPRSEISQIIPYKVSLIIPCSLELSGYSNH